MLCSGYLANYKQVVGLRITHATNTSIYLNVSNTLDFNGHKSIMDIT